MAFELPLDIQKLDIPATMDSRGTDSRCGAAFEAADPVRAATREKATTHDKLVHDASQADGVGETCNAGLMDGAASIRRDLVAAQKADEKRQADNRDTQMLLAAQRLASFEGGLEAQYGENFALDLLGDLTEDGHFTDEEYQKFASIEDKGERRKAIAQAIQDKIDAGEIDPADLDGHPWAREWLDLHEEAIAEQKNKRDNSLEKGSLDNESKKEAGVVDEVARETDNHNLIREVKVADAGADDSVEQADANYSFTLPTPG